MKTMIYTGLLSEHDYGAAYGILFLSSLREPLARELEWMSGKQVSIRYWVTDQQMSQEDATEAALRQMLGVAEVEFGSRYSELTGYLWTDENLTVGGHDLMAELHGNVGKWLILEVTGEVRR